jgi:hypothetical protein
MTAVLQNSDDDESRELNFRQVESQRCVAARLTIHITATTAQPRMNRRAAIPLAGVSNGKSDGELRDGCDRQNFINAVIVTE